MEENDSDKTTALRESRLRQSVATAANRQRLGVLLNQLQNLIRKGVIVIEEGSLEIFTPQSTNQLELLMHFLDETNSSDSDQFLHSVNWGQLREGELQSSLTITANYPNEQRTFTAQLYESGGLIFSYQLVTNR